MVPYEMLSQAVWVVCCVRRDGLVAHQAHNLLVMLNVVHAHQHTAKHASTVLLHLSHTCFMLL